MFCILLCESLDITVGKVNQQIIISEEADDFSHCAHLSDVNQELNYNCSEEQLIIQAAYPGFTSASVSYTDWQQQCWEITYFWVNYVNWSNINMVCAKNCEIGQNYVGNNADISYIQKHAVPMLEVHVELLTIACFAALNTELVEVLSELKLSFFSLKYLLYLSSRSCISIKYNTPEDFTNQQMCSLVVCNIDFYKSSHIYGDSVCEKLYIILFKYGQKLGRFSVLKWWGWCWVVQVIWWSWWESQVLEHKIKLKYYNGVQLAIFIKKGHLNGINSTTLCLGTKS